jgi:hypothetical protein
MAIITWHPRLFFSSRTQQDHQARDEASHAGERDDEHRPVVTRAQERPHSPRGDADA